MKVFYKIKILSLSVMFFLLFNIGSLILTNIKCSDILCLSVTERFFSDRNFSDDIIESLFLQKMQGDKQHKKNDESKQKDNKFDGFLVSDKIVPVITNVNTFSYMLSDIKNVCVSVCLNSEINYPLKIPFWKIIFLLLILKVLFNVLPRSISVNYNIKNIERACIV
jgi:hypothetical protein